MKYKNIELELPPLGEVLVTLEDNRDARIGYFFLRNGERLFYRMCTIYAGDPRDLLCDGTTIKWAKLPKFKLVKKEQPPLGIEVLLSCTCKTGRGYTTGVNIKDWNLEKRLQDNIIDSWIEIEAFKEDK